MIFYAIGTEHGIMVAGLHPDWKTTIEYIPNEEEEKISPLFIFVIQEDHGPLEFKDMKKIYKWDTSRKEWRKLKQEEPQAKRRIPK